jgi:TIR domain
MPLRQPPERFQVAFSLAGEQRALVRPIVEAVEKELGSPHVFFDEWFEHYIAGADAELKLQRIYGERCALVVVCISSHYNDKPWTLAEFEAIRARQMKARASADERDRLSILPIRVGDGEVEGIPFNTIAPDMRNKSAAEAAEFVLARLRLISPSLDPVKLPDWPDEAPPVHWPIANHTEVRTAFMSLLTRTSPCRVLLVRGPSEAGKSDITRQILGNALRLPDLACGRFDFKGTTEMDEELRAFVGQLDVPFPATGRLSDRLGQVLDALKRRARPALLIFDTYEAAGEAHDWMEKQLLPAVIRATWLRVVIAGQKVPNRSGAIWEPNAAPLITLAPPPPADWLAFARLHNVDVTLENVEMICRLAMNKASTIRELLGPRT